MKAGIPVTSHRVSREENGRLAAALAAVLAAVLAASVLAVAVSSTADAAFPGKNGKIVFASDRLTPENPIKIVATDAAKNVEKESWYFTIK